MTSFKRWFGAGAIVLVALALVACPALVPDPVGKITPMTLTVGDAAQTVTDVDDLFTNTDDRSTFVAKSVPETVATASISGTTLTVTPVAEGKATVTITATLSNGKTATTSFMVTVKPKPADPPPPVVDTQNDGPRMFRDLPDLNDLKVDVTPDPIDLSMHFRDDEGDDITYGAVADDTNVVMPSVSGVMLTITVRAPGMTPIHVTATDEHGLSVTESFDVMVINQPPMVQDSEPTKFGPFMPEATQVIVLSRYFVDPEGEPLTFTAMSDMTDYVTASDPGDGNTTTITAVDAGEAMITITANDGTNDPVSHMLTVTVVATPVVVPPNNPPTSSGINNMSLVAGQDSDLDLTDYFTDPESDAMTFTAMSDNDLIATASDPGAGSMTTITAVSAGRAKITVTADDDTNDPVSDMFYVTVTAAPNMAPTVKGEGLPSIKRVLDAGADGTLGNADDGVEVPDIDLSMYFEDPESYPLVFNAEVMEQDPDDAVEIVDMGTGVTNTGSKPDGTDFDKYLSIDLKKAGTATIKVTARDNADLTVSDTFEITIGESNNSPIRAADATPAVTGALAPPSYTAASGATETDVLKETLKIGDSVTPIKDGKIGLYFSDPDFITNTQVGGGGEMLTFEVKQFPFGTSNADAILAATKELDDGKKGVTADVMPKTWSGLETAKFTLTLVAERGTEIDAVGTDHGQVVALIATDQYGAKVAHVFNVRVNHPPMAYGDQEEEDDRKVLRDETMYQDLTAPANAGADAQAVTATVPLVVANGGYFSDADGAEDLADGTLGTGAGCVIKSTGGNDKAASFEITEASAGVSSLEIKALEVGAKTVTIACTDTFGVESDSSTLTVEVTGKITGSEQ